MDFEFTVGDDKKKVRTDAKSPRATVAIDDQSYEVDWQRVEGGIISLIIDGRSHTARVARRDGGVVVHVDGREFRLDTGGGDDDSAVLAAAAGGAGGIIKAPMPGSVVKVMVEEGETVTAGQSIVVVEAMKMENEVRSPVDGVVTAVNVKKGDSVGTTEPMVEIEPAETED